MEWQGRFVPATRQIGLAHLSLPPRHLSCVAVFEALGLVENFPKSLNRFAGDYQFLRITLVTWKFRIDVLDPKQLSVDEFQQSLNFVQVQFHGEGLHVSAYCNTMISQALPLFTTVAGSNALHAGSANGSALKNACSPVAVRTGFRSALPKPSNCTCIQSPSCKRTPSPKLNASAPKKWMWTSPGRRCASNLK